MLKKQIKTITMKMVAYNESIIFSLDCIYDDGHNKFSGFAYFLFILGFIFHFNKYYIDIWYRNSGLKLLEN